MKPVIVDSSVFIAAIDTREQYAKEASRLLGRVKSSSLIVPTLVVAETIVVLGRHGYLNIEQLLDRFAVFSIVDLDLGAVDSLVEFLGDYPNTGLKTADAIIAATAVRLRATLVTRDRRLLSSSGRWGEVMTPTEYLRSLQKLQ